MPHFMIGLIPYNNLLKLSWIIKCLFYLRNMEAFKEDSKVINHKWVNNHACSLPQNIHFFFFFGSEKLSFSFVLKKSGVPTIFLNLYTKLPLTITKYFD